MPKVKGQKSLLVATIPHPTKMTVDLELKVRTKGIRFKELYKILISYFIYDRKSETRETLKEMLGIVHLKIIDLRELKLIERPSKDVLSMETLIMTKIQKDSDSAADFFLDFIKRNKLVEDLYYANEYEYFGKICNLKPISLRYDRRPQKQHHHRYVGVGYKDKGSAKKLNIDGSPAWQEVAQNGDKVNEITGYTNSLLVKEGELLETKQVSVPTNSKSIFNRSPNLILNSSRYKIKNSKEITIIERDKNIYRSLEWQLAEQDFKSCVLKLSEKLKMTISPVTLAGGDGGFLLTEKHLKSKQIVSLRSQQSFNWLESVRK